MGGVGFQEGELVVEREPNELDQLAVAFTAILDGLDIRHVYVAGYVAVLTGRARTTQDVDVSLEPIDESRVEQLVEALEDDGMWGQAMPLEEMYEMLANGDNVWIAPDEQVIPHVEAKFARDESDFTARELVHRPGRRCRGSHRTAGARDFVQTLSRLPEGFRRRGSPLHALRGDP